MRRDQPETELDEILEDRPGSPTIHRTEIDHADRAAWRDQDIPRAQVVMEQARGLKLPESRSQGGHHASPVFARHWLRQGFGEQASFQAAAHEDATACVDMRTKQAWQGDIGRRGRQEALLAQQLDPVPARRRARERKTLRHDVVGHEIATAHLARPEGTAVGFVQRRGEAERRLAAQDPTRAADIQPAPHPGDVCVEFAYWPREPEMTQPGGIV